MWKLKQKYCWNNPRETLFLAANSIKLFPKAASRAYLSSRFPTRSDTNRAVRPHRMARCLKFRILEVESMYYVCSENKGADQLRGNRAADLRLYFRMYKKAKFPS